MPTWLIILGFHIEALILTGLFLLVATQFYKWEQTDGWRSLRWNIMGMMKEVSSGFGSQYSHSIEINGLFGMGGIVTGLVMAALISRMS